MDNLKRDMDNVKTKLKEDTNRVAERFAPLFDANKYSSDYIKKARSEQEKELSLLNKAYYEKIDEIADKYINNLKVDTKEIESDRYQLRLSNTLKLIEMADGNIDKDNLNFIVAAKDSNILSILKSKYPKSFAISQAFKEGHIDTVKYEIVELREDYKNSVAFSNIFKNRF